MKVSVAQMERDGFFKKRAELEQLLDGLLSMPPDSKWRAKKLKAVSLTLKFKVSIIAQHSNVVHNHKKGLI